MSSVVVSESAALLLGTALFMAAWESTSESDRDRIGETLIESGQEPAAAKRFLAMFGHDFIPKQPLPV